MESTMNVESVEQSEETTVDVFLVHGTFVPNAAWVKKGSKLRKGLRKKLAGKVNFIPLPWSGSNKARSREAAAKRLKDLVDASEANKIVIVGHSHGGSLAANALLTDNLTNTKPIRLITLNTPFLVPMLRSIQVRMFHAFLLFAGISFAVSQFYSFDLGLLSSMLGFLVAMAIGLPTVFFLLSGSRFERFVEAQLQYKKGYSINTQALIIGTADDEALGALQTADTLANLPFLLLHVFVLLAGLIVTIFLHFYFEWDLQHTGLVLIAKLTEGSTMVSSEGIAGLELNKWGVLLDVFSGISQSTNIDHLNEIVWGRCPVEGSTKCDVPTAIRWIAVFLSSFDYFILFWTSVAAVGLSVAFLVYIGPYGAPLSLQTLLAAMVIRIRVSLVPLAIPDSRFLPSDSEVGLLRHSNLYNNEAVIDFMALWINTDSTFDILKNVSKKYDELRATQ